MFENVSKLTINNKEVRKITLDDGGVIYDSLPHIRIPYLIATGQQYVNTNVIIPNDYNFEIKSTFRMKTPNNCYFWGQDGGSYNFNNFGCHINTANSDGLTFINLRNNWSARKITNLSNFTDFLNVTQKRLMNTVNGIEYPYPIDNQAVASIPLYLCCTNRAGLPMFFATCDMANWTYEVDGVAVINYEAIKMKDTGRVGFYDTVSKTYKFSEGSAEFIEGTEQAEMLMRLNVTPKSTQSEQLTQLQNLGIEV